MLFWIDGSAADAHLFVSSSEHIRCLGNLIHSAREGRHALFGDRDLLRTLEQSELLSATDRAYLAFASRRLTQDGVWISGMKKIRVDVVSKGPHLATDGWRLPLCLFDDVDLLETPILLGENIRDAKFYSHHATLFVHEMMSGYLARFLVVHGGGQQTSEALADYLDGTKRLVVCVVDSDREVEAGKLGSVSSECIDALESRSTEAYRAMVVPISARSVENLITPRLWDVLIVGMEESHERGRRLLERLPERVSLFVDIKNGDALCRFYADQTINPDDCLDPDLPCPSCGRDFSCHVTPSFGGKRLLRRAIDHLEGLTHARGDASRWAAALRKLCEDLGAFGLTLPPMRV